VCCSYNHHAIPQTTRAYALIAIISHSIARLKSSPHKTPVYMLLLYLTPISTPTHIKPDSQMVQSTAFSQSESRTRIYPEGEWQRVLYTFIFSHRHASRFLSVLFMPLTPLYSSLLPFFHSALECYLSCLPSSPYCLYPPTLSPRKALMLYTIQQPWEEVIVRQTRVNEASIATTIICEQKCGENQGLNTILNLNLNFLFLIFLF
jgi:hypothetical protein